MTTSNTTTITTTTTDMMDTLHPHLLWVQDDSYIHVTVEIENCGPCSFEVGNRLYLETVSNTTKKTYRVDMPLWGSIIMEECQFQWNPAKIYITLRKKSDTPWTYLTSQHSQWKNWIRTDWKDWNNLLESEKSEESEESEEPYRVQVSESVDNEDDLGDLLEALNPDTLLPTSLPDVDDSDLTEYDRDQILVDTLEEI